MTHEYFTMTTEQSDTLDLIQADQNVTGTDIMTDNGDMIVDIEDHMCPGHYIVVDREGNII